MVALGLPSGNPFALTPVYARGFLTLDVTPVPDSNRFDALGTMPDGTQFPVALVVADRITAGLRDLAAASPKLFIEGDLSTDADNRYVLVVRNATAAAADSYCNSVVGVAGVGNEGRISKSGKTIVRGLAVGDSEQPSWFNLRVPTSSVYCPALRDASAGTRCMFAGSLAVSTTPGSGDDDTTEGTPARPYYYVQSARFEIIAPGGAPVAPAGTTRLVHNDDLP